MKFLTESIGAVVVLSMLLGSVGCSAYKAQPKNEADRAELHADAEAAIAAFRSEDPSMARFFESAVGYAVFPTVGKGGLVFGGAYGLGVVYEGGQIVGYATLSQGTFGAQIGGQSYREIIFFEQELNLRKFQAGDFEFGAQASAVAATKGTSTDVDYEDGVAVFTIPKKGLMAEATVGGQKFSYVDAP